MPQKKAITKKIQNTWKKKGGKNIKKHHNIL